MSSSEESFFTAPIPCDLLCPICSDILKNPVLTPCQHLFCEQDLLQWFCRAPDDQGERPSQRCPQCNTICAPDSIKPAGRLLCNILGDLERRCAVESCTWTGKNCDYARPGSNQKITPLIPWRVITYYMMHAICSSLML